MEWSRPPPLFPALDPPILRLPESVLVALQSLEIIFPVFGFIYTFFSLRKQNQFNVDSMSPH